MLHCYVSNIQAFLFEPVKYHSSKIGQSQSIPIDELCKRVQMGASTSSTQSSEEDGLPVSWKDKSDSLQGKVAELRQELAMGGKKDKNHSAKKIALKKIVANMTMSNNDMVALFPDIVQCMHIPSLEIKKM